MERDQSPSANEFGVRRISERPAARIMSATVFAALALLAILVAPTSAAAPTVSIDPAYSLGIVSAKAKGKVTPGGQDTSWRFDYISDAQFDQNEANGLPGFEGAGSAGSGSIAAADPETPVEATLEGLTPSTEYHLRLVAENADGTEFALAPNFTTAGATAPILVLDPATAVSYTSVHLSGTVDPEGGNVDPNVGTLPVSWELQLSTDPVNAGWGAYLGGTFEGEEAKSSAPIVVGGDIGGLANNTEYKFRLRVAYANKEALTTEGSFKTFLVTAPAVDATAAGPIAGNTARLNGTVTPGNPDPAFDSNCTFDYVSDAQFQLDGFTSTQSIECVPGVVSGTTPGPIGVHADPKLEPHTIYHVRLRASNQGGETVDVGPNLETEIAEPTIVGTSVSDVTKSTAMLRAQLKASGASTSYHFEYLTSADYEAAGGGFAGAAKTPETALPFADNQTRPASAAIAGLQPGTAYRFRVVATNERSPVGGTTGPVRSFLTNEAGSNPAETCPNADIREKQKSTRLPECRAYELVNPANINYGDMMRMPPTGDPDNWAAFASMVAGDDALSSMVGSYMMAHRTANGWVTEDSNLTTKPGFVAEGTVSAYLARYSTDHRSALLPTAVGVDSADKGGYDLYRLKVGSGQAEWATAGRNGESGGGMRTIESTPDLSRVAFTKTIDLVPEEPIPPNLYGEGGVYVREGDQVSVVSVLPDGQPAAASAVGYMASSGFYAGAFGDWEGAAPPVRGARSTSVDVRRVYFMTGGPYGNNVLYVRDMTTDPLRTVVVSASERTGDGGYAVHNFSFISTTADGSVAYFSSAEQLTDEATLGGGIYRFDLNAPAGERLTQITPFNGNPEEFGQQKGLGPSSAMLSEDDARLYFASPTKLTPDAVAGKSNVYLWDGASLELVGTFGEEGKLERITPDGRFVLITSRASVGGAAVNGRVAIYRYDAASRDLDCVSCRPDGSDSAGDAAMYTVPDAPIIISVSQSRNLTEDGAVFFQSTDRLVATDENSAYDVYLWRDGKTSLLSAGTGVRPVYLGDNSSDGKTVILASSTPFARVDRDAGELDVYAVRVNGGFTEPPPPPAACEGESCRGAASTPPSGPGAASAVFEGAGDPPVRCGKGKFRRNGKCVLRNTHRKHKHGTKRAGQKKNAAQKRDANQKGRAGR
jgi:hypothetical protein